jgi:hypothetical protein
MSDEVRNARHYIKTFCTYTLPGTEWVDTKTRRIQLDNMTDDDALFVASEFQRMEAEVARRSAMKRKPD